MSAALQFPPVEAAAASPEGDRRTSAVDDDGDRRTTVRLTEPERAPDDPEVRLEPPLDPLDVDRLTVSRDELAVVASCRRAA